MYFDNDAKRFAPRHGAASDATHVQSVMSLINSSLTDLGLAT